MSEEVSAEEQIQGTILVVGGACTFALVALVVKTDTLPLLVATQCRFLVCWIVAVAFMLKYRKARNLEWFGPCELRKWLLLKCAVSFAFLMCWWAAIKRAPVGDCIALIYASPVLTSLIARVTLKEKIPREFPLQTLMVTIGMTMVVDPPFLRRSFLKSSSEAAPQSDYTCVFLALGICAIVPIVTRKAKDCSWIEVEHVSAVVAAGLLNPALILAQYLLGGGFPLLPTGAPTEMRLILLAAVGSFVGLGMETKGYQLAEVGKASMYKYVEVPFAYVLQHFGTSEPVQIQAVIGSGFIMASCFLSIMRTASAREIEVSDGESGKAFTPLAESSAA